MGVSAVKRALTAKLQTLAELALLLNLTIVVVQGAQATSSSALSLALLLPPTTAPSSNTQRTSLASGVKSLCNANIQRPHMINWHKDEVFGSNMLGSWYLEAVSQSSPSTSQCVKQTFNYVDMHFGVLDKTMYVVPEKNEETHLGDESIMEVRSFGMFDPVNNPNTVMSMIDLDEGERILVEAIILDTDYSTYAIGYECGGGSAAEDSDTFPSTPLTAGFEHMAILTRSPMPMSATQRARLIRRAWSLIPSNLRNSHTFHQVSKSACGSSNGILSTEAGKKANKLRAQEEHHHLLVNPEEAAAYVRADPRAFSIDSYKSVESRSAPAAFLLNDLL